MVKRAGYEPATDPLPGLASNSRNSTLIRSCVKEIRKVATTHFRRQKKRAGASHSPHPKATCPHPTRPLRSPGR
jgi:hypothetical protein